MTCPKCKEEINSSVFVEDLKVMYQRLSYVNARLGELQDYLLKLREDLEEYKADIDLCTKKHSEWGEEL